MEIAKKVSLKDKNEFLTGGNAAYFCEPQSADDFCQAILYAKDNDLKIDILGGGANILVSDSGHDGLVIRPRLNDFTINKQAGTITVGSGVTIQECIDMSLENNLLGLEEFSGIPGTVGGAVYMNIHYFKFFLSDFLAHATLIEMVTGKILYVDHSWFKFGYDQSKLHEKKFFLIDATFNIKNSSSIESAYARGRRDEIIRHRKSRYPSSHTCGSFFRNFNEDELQYVVNAKKLPFIAYYLDQLGIKGTLSHGGASVSHQHANMIVTNDFSTSNDIIYLARQMQELVFERFGIIPVPECQFLGFADFPLHVKAHLAKSSHGNLSLEKS